jgi:hypothetical protein
MSAKQLELVSGAVEQVNSKGTGIKVLGEWLNVSMYRPVNPMPTAGQLVEAQVERTDKGAWINSLHIIEGAPTAAPSTTPGPDRGQTITRLAVLKAAAHFVGLWGQTREDVKSEYVLMLADRWLAWVERTENGA